MLITTRQVHAVDTGSEAHADAYGPLRQPAGSR